MAPARRDTDLLEDLFSEISEQIVLASPSAHCVPSSPVEAHPG